MNTLKPLVEFYKTRKWGQGDHWHSHNAYCLIEARMELNLHSMGAIANELRRRCAGDPVKFNDAPGRTFEDVLEMLNQDDTA